MVSAALDRPNQAERTAEQTPMVNGRGICQAAELYILLKTGVYYGLQRIICTK